MSPRLLRRAGWNVVGVVLFLVLVFPVFWMISTSFKPADEINSQTPTWFSGQPTLQHFRDAIHKPFFTPSVSEILLESFLTTPKRRSTLSNREHCVAKLITEGHSNRQTAEILNISIKTVETHRAAVMRKLNLLSSADLVRYAVRNKLVEL